MNERQKAIALERLARHLEEVITDYMGLKQLFMDGDDSDQDMGLAVATRALRVEEEVLQVKRLARQWKGTEHDS